MTQTRRDFLTQTTAMAVAAAALPRPAFGIGRPDADPIRIGVIGCGGRGTGAVHNALAASENVSLTAIGDLFPDHLAAARRHFASTANDNADFARKYQVPEDHCFTGFDAYTQVLATDVDLVILATPPAFRSLHLTAAIAAGKHVFMEKPVAVDVRTALEVIAAADSATRQGLAIVAGTQRRHDPHYIATIARLHDGAIGDILTGQIYWNQGGLWSHQRQPEWSDTEYQLRNWLYYTWASGDHIVEQHVHNLDVANWVMGAHPVRALGMGGRQTRTDPLYGHIYDHFVVEYEYPDGRRITSMCRQQDGTASRVGEHFQGTRGSSNGYDTITTATPWHHPEVDVDPYVEEHRDLVASIRAGTPLNEGRRIAESTLSAIMGRESCYTGQVVSYDELIASGLDIMPAPIALGPLATPAVATPGETTLDRGFTEGW